MSLNIQLCLFDLLFALVDAIDHSSFVEARKSTGICGAKGRAKVSL